MNKLVPIALLFGGLTIFSHSFENAFTTSKQMPATAKTVMKSLQASSTTNSPQFNIADLHKEFNLENVNGISLTDDVKAVTDKLGQPLSKAKDPDIAEMEVYTFPEMNIGFSDGIVSYVEVLVTAGTINIDGVSIPINQEALINALGEPDFVAEDGIVFQRHSALVKLFTDMETHEVTAIHYYHYSST
jgi:hypothetical protein